MSADKEEIRERNDIVEVISASVALKRRGRDWLGLCPLHDEKTPSFHVVPATQSFKCFGCGASGDVFTFVQRRENMSFVEAAEFLARRVGLTFAKGDKAGTSEGTSEKERLYEMNGLAVAYFRRMLSKAFAASEYLAGRGLTADSIDRFSLGFAPEGWSGLVAYLQSQRHDMQTASRAGLIQMGKTGDYFDMFRNRLMFPIHDDQNRVVGFGGRAIGDDQPKYLNTGETPVFVKSKLLYGAPFARKSIGTNGMCLLMEGYMDVIAAHQGGFDNAVATLGTSLTADHATKLARLMSGSAEVALVYDGDSAGIKATLRSSEILEAAGIRVRVVRLPAGDDPDSLLRAEGGKTRFQAAIDGGLGRVEDLLRRVVDQADLAAPAGRADALKKAIYILAGVGTRSERDAYIELVWQLHPMSAHGPGIAKEQMHRDADQLAAQRVAKARAAARRTAGSAPPAQPTRNAPTQPPPPASRGLRSEARAELELARALLDPEWRSTVLRLVDRSDLSGGTVGSLYDFVCSNQDDLAPELDKVLTLMSRIGPEGLADQVRNLMQESAISAVNVPLSSASVAGCAHTLRAARAARLSEELARILQSVSEFTHEDIDRVRKYETMIEQLRRTNPDQP